MNERLLPPPRKLTRGLRPAGRVATQALCGWPAGYAACRPVLQQLTIWPHLRPLKKCSLAAAPSLVFNIEKSCTATAVLSETILEFYKNNVRRGMGTEIAQ